MDANFETVDENCNWILQVVKCTRLAQRLGVDKEKVCRLSTLSKGAAGIGSNPMHIYSNIFYSCVYGNPKDSLHSQTQAIKSDVRSSAIELASVTLFEIRVTASKYIYQTADVAELVDAAGLGPAIARCGGSSPFARTTK